MSGQSSRELWKDDNSVAERMGKLLKKSSSEFMETVFNFGMTIDEMLAFLLQSLELKSPTVFGDLHLEDLNYRKSVIKTIIQSRKEEPPISPNDPKPIDPSPNPPVFKSGEECVRWHQKKGGLELLRQMYEYYQYECAIAESEKTNPGNLYEDLKKTKEGESLEIIQEIASVISGDYYSYETA
jgi:hypothetical protein